VCEFIHIARANDRKPTSVGIVKFCSGIPSRHGAADPEFPLFRHNIINALCFGVVLARVRAALREDLGAADRFAGVLDGPPAFGCILSFALALA
jgi:hypothetical protein